MVIHLLKNERKIPQKNEIKNYWKTKVIIPSIPFNYITKKGNKSLPSLI